MPPVRAGDLRLGRRRRDRHAGTQRDGREPFHQMPHGCSLQFARVGRGPDSSVLAGALVLPLVPGLARRQASVRRQAETSEVASVCGCGWPQFLTLHRGAARGCGSGQPHPCRLGQGRRDPAGGGQDRQRADRQYGRALLDELPAEPASPAGGWPDCGRPRRGGGRVLPSPVGPGRRQHTPIHRQPRQDRRAATVPRSDAECPMEKRLISTR